MSISLTGPLKVWVEQQVVARGFGTPDEYVREMLRREQLRQTRAAVDANLLESLDSGEATEMTQADWDQIRRQGLSQPPVSHAG